MRILMSAPTPRIGCGARSTVARRDPRFINYRQRRQRLTLALRAMDGASYRVIAEVFFGRRRIPERPGRPTSCERTIRLAQAGLALMRGARIAPPIIS
jgi:hypothetical protein